MNLSFKTKFGNDFQRIPFMLQVPFLAGVRGKNSVKIMEC